MLEGFETYSGLFLQHNQSQTCGSNMMNMTIDYETCVSESMALMWMMPSSNYINYHFMKFAIAQLEYFDREYQLMLMLILKTDVQVVLLVDMSFAILN